MGDTNVRGMMPRTALIQWLVGTGREIPADIQVLLVRGLYGTLPIFVGGILNTLVISGLIAARIPTWPFLAWAAFELVLALVRVPVLIAGRRASARGDLGPIGLYLLLAMLWSASVGYGSFISLASGDWVAAALAGLSAAGMVGGICFRYYGAPRVVGAMIVLSLGPCALGGAISGEPILLICCLQLPVYMVAMTMAAYQLNAMLVRTMSAEQDNARQARHDVLTGLLNRAGLARALDERNAGADRDRATVFYVDLDGFKAVNDTFGHGVGDSLLQSVAERLRGAVRPADIVARLGGDEFLIVTDHHDAAAAERTGERLIAAISDTPYLFGDEAALIGASIGIAVRTEDDEDFGGLIARADASLYVAKTRRRRVAVPPARQPIHLQLVPKAS